MRDRWKDEKKILSEAEKNYPSAMKIIDYRGEREFLGRKQEQFLSNKIENIELNGGLNPEWRLLRYQGSFVRSAFRILLWILFSIIAESEQRVSNTNTEVQRSWRGEGSFNDTI